MGRCVKCEVMWSGPDPCWACGGPGTGVLGWGSGTTPTSESRTPPVLRRLPDGHLEGWERRTAMATWVREELARRLPWLRLGGVS